MKNKNRSSTGRLAARSKYASVAYWNPEFGFQGAIRAENYRADVDQCFADLDVMGLEPHIKAALAILREPSTAIDRYTFENRYAEKLNLRNEDRLARIAEPASPELLKFMQTLLGSLSALEPIQHFQRKWGWALLAPIHHKFNQPDIQLLKTLVVLSPVSLSSLDIRSIGFQHESVERVEFTFNKGFSTALMIEELEVMLTKRGLFARETIGKKVRPRFDEFPENIRIFDLAQRGLGPKEIAGEVFNDPELRSTVPQRLAGISKFVGLFTNAGVRQVSP